MVVRGRRQRAMGPVLLAVGGALFAAFALMAASSKDAAALTNCSVTHDGNDGEELAFLGLINNYRQSSGLGALTISTNLNRGAAWMVEDMATKAYFAHTDSLGRSPSQRAMDCGYPGGAGENLAAGTAWSTASAAFQAWQTSAGHNANMLGQYYQQIGIARFYLTGSQYGWYWATTFGTVNDGTGGGAAGPTATTTQPATATPTRTPTIAAATSTPMTAAATNTPTPFASTSTPTTVPSTTVPTSTPTPFGSGSTTPPPVPNTPTPRPATSTPNAAV